LYIACAYEVAHASLDQCTEGECISMKGRFMRALQATIAQLNGAKGIVAIKALDDHVPHNSVNDDWSGMTGTISLGDSRAVCPPGSRVSGIQGFKISGEVAGLAGPIKSLSERLRHHPSVTPAMRMPS
jgi:hypothetical protein